MTTSETRQRLSTLILRTTTLKQCRILIGHKYHAPRQLSVNYRKTNAPFHWRFKFSKNSRSNNRVTGRRNKTKGQRFGTSKTLTESVLQIWDAAWTSYSDHSIIQWHLHVSPAAVHSWKHASCALNVFCHGACCSIEQILVKTNLATTENTNKQQQLQTGKLNNFYAIHC